MNTPFEEEVPLVDKNPRLDSSSDLSDLSDMDCSDQDLGGQPSSPAASAPHDGRNTGDTTMMDVAITSPADEATITPPAPVDAPPTPGPYAWYTPTFPDLLRPRKKIATHIRREVASIPLTSLGAHIQSSLAASERAFKLLMPDDLVRSTTGKTALAPHLLTTATGKAATSIAAHYTAGAPSTALLGALAASNPGLGADLTAVIDAVKAEHEFLIGRLGKAVLRGTEAEKALVQTAFESREKSEELGLDPALPFENRVAFLERMAAATHLLVTDARDPELLPDGEGRELERALRAAHFLIEDALGDASLRRRTVEDAVEAARKIARDLEDRWITGHAASVQGKDGSGVDKPATPKPKKNETKRKRVASVSGSASALDTFASSPPPILPAIHPANSDFISSGSDFSMQTDSVSGNKTSPVRKEPAHASHSASSPPASSGAHFLFNPPREAVRRPTANPTRQTSGNSGLSFDASPSSAGRSRLSFSITGLDSAEAIPFGPGSTIPYSTGPKVPGLGFPSLPASYVASAQAASASIRNPLCAASDASGSVRRKEKMKEGDSVP